MMVMPSPALEFLRRLSLKRPALILLPFIAWGLAIYQTTHEAFRSVTATLDLRITGKWDSILSSSQHTLEQQRSIQQHYLSYGVYIPIDDIVVDARQQLMGPMASLMPKVCGSGRAFVWIPLPLHIPLVGEKVIEWCLVKA
jgi:hypothetical protein